VGDLQRQRHHGHRPAPQLPSHLERRRTAVENDRFAVVQLVDNRRGDRPLGLDRGRRPRRERRLHPGRHRRDRAAVDALEHALRGQKVQIAPDRHVGRTGQLDQFGDRDPGRTSEPLYDDSLTFGAFHDTEPNIFCCSFKHSAC
jgi:hypothetical protein